MKMNERDLTDEETHFPPSCEDCGAFHAKRWNEDTEEWECPSCDGKEDE